MAVYLARMFGVSLVITLVTELAVVALYRCISNLGGRRKSGKQNRKSREEVWNPGERLWGYRRNMVLLVILVNLLTNPLAVLLSFLGRICLPSVPGLLVQILLEIAVVAVEAKVYLDFAQKPGWQMRHPAGVAVAANLCSWLSGLVASRYLWLLDVLEIVWENQR